MLGVLGVLTCSCPWRAYVLVCLASLPAQHCAHVLGVFACLACSRAYVYTCLACLLVLCPYVLTCLSCFLCSSILHAYVLASFFHIVFLYI